jgi:uncharacterized oligopeptide transporter (OPT) family protein
MIERNRPSRVQELSLSSASEVTSLELDKLLAWRAVCVLSFYLMGYLLSAAFGLVISLLGPLLDAMTGIFGGVFCLCASTLHALLGARIVLREG